MPVLNTDTFLVLLKEKEKWETLAKWLEEGFRFEVLTPSEVLDGQEFHSLQYPEEITSLKEKVAVLDQVLTPILGKISGSFLDKRFAVDQETWEAVLAEEDFLSEVAQNLSQYQQTEQTLRSLRSFLGPLSGQQVLFGENLKTFASEFELHMNKILHKTNLYLPNEDFTDTWPEVKISYRLVQEREAISFDKNWTKEVLAFAGQKFSYSQELLDDQEVLISLQQNLFNLKKHLSQEQIDPDNLDSSLTLRLAVLRACYSQKLELVQLSEQNFSLQNQKNSHYLAISLHPGQSLDFGEYLQKNQIPFLDTAQSRRTLWEQNGDTAQAFQTQLFEPLGALDKLDADPVWLTICFFSLFVALGISNVFLAFFSLFILVILLQLPLQKNLRRNLQMLIYPSLFALVWGILSGAWAGIFTALNLREGQTFVANFQLLDLFGANQQAPLNLWLGINNDWQNLRLGLILALVLGLLHLAASQYFRIFQAQKEHSASSLPKEIFSLIFLIAFSFASISLLLLPNIDQFAALGLVFLTFLGIFLTPFLSQSKPSDQTDLAQTPSFPKQLTQLILTLPQYLPFLALAFFGNFLAQNMNFWLSPWLTTDNLPLKIGAISALVLGYLLLTFFSLFLSYLYALYLSKKYFIGSFFQSENKLFQPFSPRFKYIYLKKPKD